MNGLGKQMFDVSTQDLKWDQSLWLCFSASTSSCMGTGVIQAELECFSFFGEMLWFLHVNTVLH